MKISHPIPPTFVRFAHSPSHFVGPSLYQTEGG